jgi:hypothetical protein
VYFFLLSVLERDLSLLSLSLDLLLFLELYGVLCGVVSSASANSCRNVEIWLIRAVLLDLLVGCSSSLYFCLFCFFLGAVVRFAAAWWEVPGGDLVAEDDDGFRLCPLFCVDLDRRVELDAAGGVADLDLDGDRWRWFDAEESADWSRDWCADDI